MKLTDLVNVFHGTGNVDAPVPQGVAATWQPIKPLTGNTSPGAVLPFGKYAVCAYSGGYSSGYGVNVSNSTADPIPTLMDTMRIKGFSHFQNSGTGGITVYYNYAVVTPYYGEKAADYGMREETGHPGYYAVTLEETGVRCELTVDKTAAYHRYTFSRPDGRIAIDFKNDGLYDSPRLRGIPENVTVRRVDGATLHAAANLQGVRLYFAVTAEGNGAFGEDGVYRLAEAGSVTLKVSVSAVSEADAREENARAVATFDEAVTAADIAWEEALSAIRVDFDDPIETELFYSNLYHTIVKPNDWETGSFLWEDGPFVVDFSTLWDMYKSQLPLVFTLYPQVSAHIVDTFQRLGETLGHFPNTFMLSRNMDICAEQAQLLTEHALYDAWKRGIPADWEAIYRTVLDDMDSDAMRAYAEKGKGECASHTLDMAIGCTAMAEMGRALGFSREADRLEALADNWKNVFDPATGILRDEGVYYEGNHWTYSFRPLPRQEERVALCGGKEAYVALLDRFFGFTHGEDVSARFEGFNNECDMEAPYAYHCVGRYDRLCDILDAADIYVYRDKQGGAGRGAIPGNNDSGGMSSCYIWNCLGLFPLSGQNTILLSRPKFRVATLQLSNGRALTVSRKGEGRYPTAVTLNGRELPHRRMTVEELMQGGILEFTM